MTEMIVVSKGCQWVVHADGTIEAPPHTTTYTRTRRGEGQTFTCEFGRRRLSPYKGRRGYLEVAAQKGGIRVKETVHRLVGMAFVPGYAEGLTTSTGSRPIIGLRILSGFLARVTPGINGRPVSWTCGAKERQEASLLLNRWCIFVSFSAGVCLLIPSR